MKKNYLISLSTLIILSMMLSACQIIPFINVVRGSGNVITEARSVSGFNNVRLNGAGRLVITQGSEESLQIQAEDNIMEQLVSNVTDDTLVLGYQEQNWLNTILPSRIITYTLSVINLSDLTINGAGDIEIDALQSEMVSLALNGAGQIVINNLTADSLTVNITGTGMINISGQATSQSVKIEGAGNYQAGDLQTTSSEIEINGLGNSTVWATNTLNVTIKGGGSVGYFGNPNVTQEILGLGEINNQGEK